MATRQEVLELMREVFYHSDKKKPLDKLKILAKEANMTPEEYVTTVSERLKNSTNKPTLELVQEKIPGVPARFLKYTPGEWISQMAASDWYKAGMPGDFYKRDAIEDTINGDDEINEMYPAMRDCSWKKVAENKRQSFLCIIIRAFQDFNEKNQKYEYLKK